MAVDDWRPWRISSPELLSRYVNHVAAAGAVNEDFLASVCGNDSHASIHDLRSSGQIDAIVQAIYQGLTRLGIKYDMEPVSLASPVTVDQEIRTPAEVVHTRLGTCLDLALFFAGLCVHVRLLPLVVLLRNITDQSAHALVVVDGKYTHDDWNEPRGWKAGDRQNAIIGRDVGRKSWGEGGELWQRVVQGDYIPVECTGFAATRADGRATDTLLFADACERAKRNLQEYSHSATLDVVCFQKGKGYIPYQPPVLRWPKFSKLGLWRRTQKADLTRLQHPFVGRGTALQVVETFLSDLNGPRRLCITAPAGYGKSALMAKLVLLHPGSIYRFVQEGETWPELLGSICTQLSALIGEHASYNGRPAIELKDAFGELVAELARNRAQENELPIFIDGLDEGLLEGPNRVTQAELLRDPPAGTRVILSCKPGLEAMLSSGNCVLLKLDEFEDADVRDLFILFGRPELANDQDLIRKLISRTAGEPFYLRYLTEDIALGQSSGPLTDRLPARAEEYLKDQIGRLHELWAIAGVGLTLAVLVQAKGWLRQASLFRMLENKVGTDATRRILQSLRPRYLTTQPPSDPARRSDESYRLWPIRLRDAICEMLIGSPDLQQGQDILINFCRSWATHRDPYALEYAYSHFLEQGNLENLAAVLTGDFLRARAKLEGGFHSPLADTERAVRLAVERRDVPKIIRTAGTHAWLQTVVAWRAAHGGIALDAHRGHIRSALSGARTIRDPHLKRVQLLVIAEALLDQGRHVEATEIVEEAMRIQGRIDVLDQPEVNTFARNLLKNTGRADLARELWKSWGGYDTAERMMAEVAEKLVRTNLDRALEIIEQISDRNVQQDALEALRCEAARQNIALPEEAIVHGDPESIEPTENVVIIEDLVKADPVQAGHFIDQGMNQCRQRLKANEKDANAIVTVNNLIIHLASIDESRAIDAAINEAGYYSRYFHRGTVLAEVGLIVAERSGSIEAMRKLLQSARAQAAHEEDSSEPSAVDRLSLALASRLSDLDEAHSVLAQMDDPNLAAEAAIARLALSGDEVARAVPVIERASRVTEEMAARFRELQSERAKQFLASLPVGPNRWWLKLAIAKADPTAVAELRSSAVEKLPPRVQLAAMMELVRRFRDPASLRRAAELLKAPATWEGEYEFKRIDKRLELARLASEVDQNLALELYRDAALDIPDGWHERARHKHAAEVFETLAETRFEADTETLQRLFGLLLTDYSRSRTIMSVRGADAVISNIADEVYASVNSVAIELLKRARDAGDASILARLDSFYPKQKILSFKLAHVNVLPPNPQERGDIVAQIVQIFSQPIPDQEYPAELIYQVGHLLAYERPDALANAAANLNLEDKPFLWIGAAAAMAPSLVGMWNRLRSWLYSPPAMQWLRRAEDAATAIETAENDRVRKDSPDNGPSLLESEDDWTRNRRAAYAAMNCAGVFANLVVLAGETLVARRRVWVARAFQALRRIKDIHYRLPQTIEIALILARFEPTLCRRQAARAIKMLPELLGKWTGIQEITEALEKERTAIAQIEIRRQTWEGIFDLAPLVTGIERLGTNTPLIERHAEFFALAGFWISKLGGAIPGSFWTQAEDAVETRFASAGMKHDDFKNEILNQVHALSIAARALSHRSEAVNDLYRLADDQKVLATTLRYFPLLPEDASCWNSLTERIRSLDALEAAARRVGDHPSSVALADLLKRYPPSSRRSKILKTLLDSTNDSALLVPLLDVAIDYPRDLAYWAATFVRTCRDNDCDLHAITDEIAALRTLSTSGLLPA